MKLYFYTRNMYLYQSLCFIKHQVEKECRVGGDIHIIDCIYTSFDNVIDFLVSEHIPEQGRVLLFNMNIPSLYSSFPWTHICVTCSVEHIKDRICTMSKSTELVQLPASYFSRLFTSCELRVMSYFANGQESEDLARQLLITDKTAYNTALRAMHKLQLPSLYFFQRYARSILHLVNYSR